MLTDMQTRQDKALEAFQSKQNDAQESFQSKQKEAQESYLSKQKEAQESFQSKQDKAQESYLSKQQSSHDNYQTKQADVMQTYLTQQTKGFGALMEGQNGGMNALFDPQPGGALPNNGDFQAPSSPEVLFDPSRFENLGTCTGKKKPPRRPLEDDSADDNQKKPAANPSTLPNSGGASDDNSDDEDDDKEPATVVRKMNFDISDGGGKPTADLKPIVSIPSYVNPFALQSQLMGQLKNMKSSGVSVFAALKETGDETMPGMANCHWVKTEKQVCGQRWETEVLSISCCIGKNSDGTKNIDQVTFVDNANEDVATLTINGPFHDFSVTVARPVETADKDLCPTDFFLKDAQGNKTSMLDKFGGVVLTLATKEDYRLPNVVRIDSMDSLREVMASSLSCGGNFKSTFDLRTCIGEMKDDEGQPVFIIMECKYDEDGDEDPLLDRLNTRSNLSDSGLFTEVLFGADTYIEAMIEGGQEVMVSVRTADAGSVRGIYSKVVNALSQVDGTTKVSLSSNISEGFGYFPLYASVMPDILENGATLVLLKFAIDRPMQKQHAKFQNLLTYDRCYLADKAESLLTTGKGLSTKFRFTSPPLEALYNALSHNVFTKLNLQHVQFHRRQLPQLWKFVKDANTAGLDIVWNPPDGEEPTTGLIFQDVECKERLVSILFLWLKSSECLSFLLTKLSLYLQTSLEHLERLVDAAENPPAQEPPVAPAAQRGRPAQEPAERPAEVPPVVQHIPLPVERPAEASPIALPSVRPTRTRAQKKQGKAPTRRSQRNKGKENKAN
ncbi:MAG: hypothetical protein SGILL_005255 [Bacillariaceae sp.]